MTSETSRERAIFREKIYDLVRTIPPGRVMTYGSIASHLVPPEGTDILAYQRIGPRWVGYAMRDCPEDVPWHRVVNAKGGISLRSDLGPPLQKKLLEEEGVEFNESGYLELKTYAWIPDHNP